MKCRYCLSELSNIQIKQPSSRPSPKQSDIETHPKNPGWLNWKSLIIAFFIAFVLNIFAAAVAGTKPAKNIIWTVWWIYLTLEAWKYWKWKALLPFPLYLFVLTIGFLFLQSAGVEYHSTPNLILLGVSNLGGLTIFYMLLHRTRSSVMSETSVNKDAEIENIIRGAELGSARKIEKTIETEPEVKQHNEEFIELLKSAVRENGLNKIPGDDLIEIYNRAKSIDASNNIPDIELSKAINAVLGEIKKRGLSQNIKPQADKQQEIYHYKDYSFKQNEAGGSSKWFYVIVISIIVISIALVVISNFSSHNLSQDEIAQISGRAGLLYGNRYSGNLYNGNSDVTLKQVTIDISTSINGIKRTRTYSIDVNIPPLKTKDFGIDIVVGDAGAEYQWSINSAIGY